MKPSPIEKGWGGMKSDSDQFIAGTISWIRAMPNSGSIKGPERGRLGARYARISDLINHGFLSSFT